MSLYSVHVFIGLHCMHGYMGSMISLIFVMKYIGTRGMKLSKQVYEISNLLEISSDEYH